MKAATVAWLLMLIVSCSSHAGLVPSIRPLHLGWERDEVRLLLVGSTSCILPPMLAERIAICHGGRPKLLSGLHQLEGLVRVTDGETALRLVRLRTSPATWHAWPDKVREVEVVAAAVRPRLPDFRVPNLRYPLPAEPSGFLGILPETAYLAGQFTAAKVEKLQEGFRITRWIYQQDLSTKRASVRQIQEVVTEDGKYRRAVLQEIPPPELPGIHWELPASQ